MLLKIQECTLCGKCFDCPYLEKYGYPKEIYQKRDISVFICTNCGLCNALCPFDVEPAYALYELKKMLISENKLSKESRDAINQARNFVKRMSRFPFTTFSFRKTVFFPGCALVSMGSKIVFSLKKILEKRLRKKIGLFIHCCSDPAYQNGDVDFVKDFVQNLKELLENGGVNKVIVACGNCKKVFKEFMSDMEVVHVLEIIEISNFEENGFIFHHPCPNFKNIEIKKSIDKVFHEKAYYIFDEPYCCGLGGSASKLDKDISMKFLKRVSERAGEKVLLTTCMGCKNRFMKNGLKAFHVYEYLTKSIIDKPIGDGRKWVNRLLVSLLSKINFLKILLFSLVIFLSLYVYNLQKSGILTLQNLMAFVKSSKYLAPLIYLLVYSIGPTVFFPSLILTILAGALWGPVYGVFFAITGATIGCSIPFLISRYLFSDVVKELFGYKRWQKLKMLVEKNGWKVVAFTRIVPIFPFPALNYLFGITPVPFIHYVVTSFVFMLPACIAYVYFGSSLIDLLIKGEVKSLILSIIIISLVMVLPYVFHLKRKSILEKTDE